ncbi:hypothetical protein JM946_13810 [Steroidobacter sp. S1-65]|uniref:Uncharacterized protein n=1 Tax=Steroidobacter gossypii TaxID=2805490 RepID=A0ABS1WXZ7_9GAMM|nr:hypothetical protein [Steroidobacter gossypii]MBM0105812.1 hypothetical protein [Steroidobacter gossypii]
MSERIDEVGPAKRTHGVAGREGAVPADALDREKWHVEQSFREREFAVKEREISIRRAEIKLKSKELARGLEESARRSNHGCGDCRSGNAVISILNGRNQRSLEAQKAEQARILEMIKTGSADKAAGNRSFCWMRG